MRAAARTASLPNLVPLAERPVSTRLLRAAAVRADMRAERPVTAGLAPTAAAAAEPAAAGTPIAAAAEGAVPEARREAAPAGTDQTAAVVAVEAPEEAVPRLRVSRPLAVVVGTVSSTITDTLASPLEGAGAEQAFRVWATAGSAELERMARYG